MGNCFRIGVSSRVLEELDYMTTTTIADIGLKKKSSRPRLHSLSRQAA